MRFEVGTDIVVADLSRVNDIMASGDPMLINAPIQTTDYKVDGYLPLLNCDDKEVLVLKEPGNPELSYMLVSK